MRTLAKITAIALCLAVSACAGTGGSNGVARSRMDNDIDVGKIIAVNDWAMRRRATVVWINYPKKLPQMKDNDG